MPGSTMRVSPSSPQVRERITDICLHAAAGLACVRWPATRSTWMWPSCASTCPCCWPTSTTAWWMCPVSRSWRGAGSRRTTTPGRRRATPTWPWPTSRRASTSSSTTAAPFSGKSEAGRTTGTRPRTSAAHACSLCRHPGRPTGSLHMSGQQGCAITESLMVCLPSTAQCPLRACSTAACNLLVPWQYSDLS